MKKNKYKMERKKMVPKKKLLFPTLISISFLFLCIGYASINDINLNIAGLVTAEAQKGIYISDVNSINENNSDIENSYINSTYGTLLNSSIILENENSVISYKVSLYNNSDFAYDFVGLNYDVSNSYSYDNPNITVDIDKSLNENNIIQPSDYMDFIITFKYNDNIEDFSKVNNSLNSILDFEFKKVEYKINFYPNRNILPEGYQEVGYLETDGNQYIDLGNTYPISTNTTVKVGTIFSDNWIYGYTAGSYGRYGATLSKFYMGTSQVTITPNVNEYYDFIFDHKNGITVKDTTYSFDKTPNNGSSGENNIYLFRANGSSVFGTGKIYYYRQYNSNNLVLDLIPCYRESDNVLGMYDLVNNKFYTNSGTGNFKFGYNTQNFVYGKSQNLIANNYIKEGYEFMGWNTKADGSGISYNNEQEVLNLSGTPDDVIYLYAQWSIDYSIKFYPNRNILPKGYQEVGYLETDGNQYINLGNTYPISTNTIVKIGTIFSDNWIYGYTAGSSGRYGATLSKIYTVTSQANITPNVNEYYDFIFDHKNGITVKDTTYSFDKTPDNGSSGQNNIYLFRANGSSVFGAGKIYYYRQYNSNNLVLDLIPCYRESDNVLGMYDLVNDKFYTNSGTGKFAFDYNTQNFIYGKSQKLIANKYIKDGYIFTGWNTKTDGSGISYTDEQEVLNLTTINNDIINLYAQWEK